MKSGRLENGRVLCVGSISTAKPKPIYLVLSALMPLFRTVAMIPPKELGLAAAQQIGAR